MEAHLHAAPCSLGTVYDIANDQRPPERHGDARAVTTPRPPSGPDAVLDLVRWAAGLRLDDVPSAVVDATRLRLLDVAGAAVAGTHADGVPQLLGVVDAWGGRAQSTIIGTTRRTSLPLAVMMNATVARALELDDVHERALLHPSVATAPIALAIAEQDDRIDGAHFLACLIAAQEVMCRIGLAPAYHVAGPDHRPRGWSFTYQAGILGGALLAALLRRYDERLTLDTLGIAYTALSGNQQAIQEPSLVIRVQQGVAAQTAVQSADLAAAGITGPHDVLEGTFGWLTYWHGGDYDRDVVVGDLGRRWEVADTSIKPYPVCRIAHNAVDATMAAVATAQAAPDDIDRIVVHVNSRESWDEVVQPLERRRRPATPMDAQFSLPFACAVAAVRGVPTLSHLTEAAIRDPAVLAMIDRVEPVLDPGYDWVVGRVMPMPVAVDVHTRDGRTVTVRSEVPYGHPHKPLDGEAVESKVRACAAAGGGEADHDALDALIDAVRNVETGDPGRLIDLLGRVRSIPA